MLKQRVLAALALAALFLAALFYFPLPLWELLMAAVALGAAWEWARLSGFGSAGRIIYMLVIGLALLILVRDDTASMDRVLSIAALCFWLIAVPIWLLRHAQLKHSFALAVVGFLVLITTWWAFVNLREFGATLILFFMGLVWIADIAAYFAGRRWGKHKLAPRISPGKTWEGVAGALVAGGLYILLWHLLVPAALARVAAISLIAQLIAGSLLVILSVVGDLFESHIKRCAGYKDSSHLIPGHGGILDRIDSQTSVLPVALALMHFSGLGR